MGSSHVAGWTSDSPTPAQLQEFFSQVKRGRITGKRLQDFLRGDAEFVIKRHLIDLDADPYLPTGWKVEQHIKGGQFAWDPTKVAFHLDEAQRAGSIEGNKLRKKLKVQRPFNANLLDYLLANPSLIPEEWKGKAVFFWGTIYRLSDGSLYARYLDWDDGQWYWNFDWLDNDWDVSNPAAVPASN